MAINLTIYKTGALKEVDRVCSVDDFRLSFGACEDILNAINIDMFEGGLEALSDESKYGEIFKVVVSAFPILKNILKDIFDVSDEELKRTSINEVVKCVIDIITYAITTLGGSISQTKGKN